MQLHLPTDKTITCDEEHMSHVKLMAKEKNHLLKMNIKAFESCKNEHKKYFID